MADAGLAAPIAATDAFAPPSAAPVTVRFLPRMTRLSFRGRPPAVAAASRTFGVALPELPCRAASGAGRAALWLGPDEWLLLLAAGDAPDGAGLAQALAGLPHSLVDISHRNVALEIAGVAAARVLNAGCPLDLDLAAFPVGMCTRTLFGKAEIVLWRTAAERFHVEVWRSFADYVWSLLREAGRELAIEASRA
jgi:sarcosine oxidase subunit gamma